MNKTSLTLITKEKKTEIPLSEILELSFTASEKDAFADTKNHQVTLVDGSRITCSQATTSGETISITSKTLGRFQLPLSSVLSIRLGNSVSQFEDAWKAVAQTGLKSDLIVIPKKKVLDRVRGVIGGIDENNVTFLLDGDEIPVKKEKVYGVIYARNRSTQGQAACDASLSNSDRLMIEEISLKGSALEARLQAGATVTLPLGLIASLDFSAGKLRYLSQIEPRDIEYTPFFDDEAERELIKYRRNRNQQGNRLRLGKTTYTRGLWIHSKTLLQYRIGTEYRRFQAVMGIDHAVASKGRGDVHIVISGDGKTLLEGDVRGTDPPRPIDLDVSGIRDLQILVDFGENLSIADHLVLAEARVIK